jgi:hypothetical protein
MRDKSGCSILAAIQNAPAEFLIPKDTLFRRKSLEVVQRSPNDLFTPTVADAEFQTDIEARDVKYVNPSYTGETSPTATPNCNDPNVSW